MRKLILALAIMGAVPMAANAGLCTTVYMGNGVWATVCS